VTSAPPDQAQATPLETPTPKAKKTPKAKSAWRVRFHYHHGSSARTDKRSLLFVPEDGRVRISWSVGPMGSDYDWAAAFFREGTNPDTSNGVGHWLMSMSGTPDDGSKRLTLKPGTAYYLWSEMWHGDGYFVVSEHK
jgi:hypothetical protein